MRGRRNWLLRMVLLSCMFRASLACATARRDARMTKRILVRSGASSRSSFVMRNLRRLVIYGCPLGFAAAHGDVVIALCPGNTRESLPFNLPASPRYRPSNSLRWSMRWFRTSHPSASCTRRMYVSQGHGARARTREIGFVAVVRWSATGQANEIRFCNSGERSRFLESIM